MGVIRMSDTTNLSIRIDRDLKEEADQLFSTLGMNLTTAITVFVRQSVRQKKIPFEITLYSDGESKSQIMREAMAASERIWENSIRNGTDNMTMEDIDSEIAAARTARKKRGADQ
jgi:DNA-damage-inducible protein J